MSGTVAVECIIILKIGSISNLPLHEIKQKRQSLNVVCLLFTIISTESKTSYIQEEDLWTCGLYKFLTIRTLSSNSVYTVQICRKCERSKPHCQMSWNALYQNLKNKVCDVKTKKSNHKGVDVSFISYKPYRAPGTSSFRFLTWSAWLHVVCGLLEIRCKKIFDPHDCGIEVRVESHNTRSIEVF